jgi:hypothetical protein
MAKKNLVKKLRLMGIPIIDEEQILKGPSVSTPRVEVAQGVFVNKSDVPAYHQAQKAKAEQSQGNGYVCPTQVAQHRRNTARTTIGSTYYPIR